MSDRPIFHPEVYAEIDSAVSDGLENWPERVGDLLEEFDAKVSLILKEDQSFEGRSNTESNG